LKSLSRLFSQQAPEAGDAAARKSAGFCSTLPVTRELSPN